MKLQNNTFNNNNAGKNNNITINFTEKKTKVIGFR